MSGESSARPWIIQKRSIGISTSDHQGGAESHATGLNPIRAESINDRGDPHGKARE